MNDQKSVKINLEIDEKTDLGELMISLDLVQKLVGDLDKGLDVEDLATLLAHNGSAMGISPLPGIAREGQEAQKA